MANMAVSPMANMAVGPDMTDTVASSKDNSAGFLMGLEAEATEYWSRCRVTPSRWTKRTREHWVAWSDFGDVAAHGLDNGTSRVVNIPRR